MTDLKENILKSDSNNSFVLISNDNKKSNEANPEPEFDISSVQALVIDPISEIMRLRKENENLKNKVETLNIKLNLKNEELVLKNNIIDELRNIEIKKLEKIIDELQIENARLSSIISDLERKVEKQQLQLDLQQTEIESLKADNKLIKASKESQQTEIESLKADNKLIKVSKESQQTEIESLKADNKLIKASKESQQTKLDKLVEDMEAMKLEKQKLEEASLISDIYHQLYKQFLLKNKDDDDIKKYIKVKTNESNKTSLKVYLAEFHAIMRDRNDISARIKSKFNNAINKNSSANLLSHENNSNIYSKICEPRNIACHSSIRDSSNFDSKKDYLQQIKSRIEIMQHHKTDGEQLFKQLQNIIDDEAAESESDRKWKNLSDWIQNTIGEDLSEGFACLEDGIILCKLMNHFHKKSLLNEKVDYSEIKSAFKIQNNISNYLYAAEDIGVPQEKLFQISDLYGKKDPSKVIESISELKKIIEKK